MSAFLPSPSCGEPVCCRGSGDQIASGPRKLLLPIYSRYSAPHVIANPAGAAARIPELESDASSKARRVRCVDANQALLSTPATPLLQATGLECWRGDRCLFSGLDLALAAGEALQVVGPNGCGKTTLLRAVCGLTRPERGALFFRGAALDGDPDAFRSELLYIGHENGLKFELTALENLRALRDIAARRRGLSLEAALQRTGLEGFEDRPVRTLSSGQRRRVALARLLIVHASLWLLDEPFTALDEAGARLVNVLVEDHLHAGGGIIFTSHIPLSLTRGSPRHIELES